MIRHVERNIWEFSEGGLCVRGEKNDMLFIAELCRRAEKAAKAVQYQDLDEDGMFEELELNGTVCDIEIRPIPKLRSAIPHFFE